LKAEIVHQRKSYTGLSLFFCSWVVKIDLWMTFETREPAVLVKHIIVKYLRTKRMISF